MAAYSAALSLLSGVVGAGFASGREIVRFFAAHGPAAFAAALSALLALYALFLRLPALMRREGASSLVALCEIRFGPRFGRLCGALLLALSALTGGAMLAACAELGALVLPIRHAYGVSLAASLALGAYLSGRDLSGLALPGLGLLLLMPALLVRLLMLPAGEACFLPAMAPDLPVRAALDGAAYGALNCAMLAGMLPLLAPLPPREHRRAVRLFSLLFGALLLLGVLACQRHLPAVLHQPLPFVCLARRLGAPGYLLVAACMYAASLSTLCAMLAALRMALPVPRAWATALAAGVCLLLSALGFGPLVNRAYPALGALGAGLLLALCLPVCPKTELPLK